MPSGSSDSHDRLYADQPRVLDKSYGPAGLTAAFVNILLLEALTWVILVLGWFMVPVTVLPAVLIDALVGYGLTRSRGTVAQIGRGLLFGCIAPLLSLIIFVPAYIIASNFWPF